MNLIKTSFLSFLATCTKMLAGLVINKCIATFVGPSGLALIGQFQNIATLIQTAAQGGINSGVTKYTAQYRNNSFEREKVWISAYQVTIIFTFLVGSFVYIFSNLISEYTVKSEDYAYIFKVFSLTLIFFSINQLMLSIINGLKEIKQFILINITQNLLSLAYTSVLIYYYQLSGALIALVTNQSIIFFITLWNFKKNKTTAISKVVKMWNSEHVRNLLKYSLMTLVTVASLPISQILVRDYITKEYSWDYAGYWQAMTYISTTYLMVVTVALSTYFLPRLSEIQEKAELRKELFKGYKVIIPVVTFMSIIVYLLKDLIIWILFSPDFRPMLVLFEWQMIGNVLKIAGWLLAYLMLAKAMVKVFVITEIIFSITFYGLSILLMNTYGFVGLSYAFALNYLLYLMVMIKIMRKHLY